MQKIIVKPRYHEHEAKINTFVMNLQCTLYIEQYGTTITTVCTAIGQ